MHEVAAGRDGATALLGSNFFDSGSNQAYVSGSEPWKPYAMALGA